MILNQIPEGNFSRRTSVERDRRDDRIPESDRCRSERNPTRRGYFPEIGTGFVSGHRGEVFLTIMEPEGAVLSSTFIGGSQDDEGSAIALTPTGSVVIVGMTFSSDFPTINAVVAARAGSRDVFLTRLNNLEPTTQRIPNIVAHVGQWVTYDIRQFVLPPGTTATFDFVSGPHGAFIDRDLGVIKWLPSDPGIRLITLKVGESIESSQVALEQFQIDVQ